MAWQRYAARIKSDFHLRHDAKKRGTFFAIAGNGVLRRFVIAAHPAAPFRPRNHSCQRGSVIVHDREASTAHHRGAQPPY